MSCVSNSTVLPAMQMPSPGAVLPAIPALGADDSARIQELERRLQELDQKYRVLERRLEIEGEAATEKAKTAPAMSIGAQGFSYRSAVNLCITDCTVANTGEKTTGGKLTSAGISLNSISGG